VTFLPSVSMVGDALHGPLVYVLHGILGSGRNWRTFARRLSERVPSARFALIDLRNHGSSVDAPPPHTIQTTADDVRRLFDPVGTPDVLIGHSFGGKVATRVALDMSSRLKHLWVLDSRLDAVQTAGVSEVDQVLRALHEAPVPFAQREDLKTYLTTRGFSEPLAQWMTTNLRRDGDGLVWAFDLQAIEQMMESYWREDVTEALSNPAIPLSLVRAGRGDRWPTDVVDRYDRLAHPGAALLELPNAGHWVHVDDPDGLEALIVPTLT
jgi:pimeloyl-ACP methyl ester carboxylesterase